MNDLQVQNSGNKPAVIPQNASGLIRSDLIIPYVVIGQSTSDPVTERKVQLGDIYRSTNLEKLGGPDQAVDAIFLSEPKANWIIEAKPPGASRFKFCRMEARTASNETLPWSYFGDEKGNELKPNGQAWKQGEPGAIECRRVKQLMVLVFYPKTLTLLRRS